MSVHVQGKVAAAGAMRLLGPMESKGEVMSC